MNDNKLVNASIIFIALVFLFVIIRDFGSFLRPFFIAVILSFLLVPITRFSKERKILIGINSLATVVIIFISITLFVTILAGDSNDIESIAGDRGLEGSVAMRFSEIEFNIFGFDFKMDNFLSSQKIAEIVSSFIGKLAGSLGTFFSEFFIVVLFLIFLLPSHDMTIKKISSKMEKESEKKFKYALSEIEKSIRSYLSIKSIISLGTAVISLFFMFIFGVKGMILYAFLIFALNFIPSIGSFIAVFIILFSHFIMIGFSWQLVILAIILILIQVFFGNILEPKIAGKELELSPVIILLSLFFWGSVWGLGGMFFAVPLTSIIKIVLTNIDSTKKIVCFLS